MRTENKVLRVGRASAPKRMVAFKTSVVNQICGASGGPGK